MHRITKTAVKSEGTENYMGIVGKLFDVMNYFGSEEALKFWFAKE